MISSMACRHRQVLCRHASLALLVLLVLAHAAAPVASAQQRSVTWDRFDVDLDVQTDGAVNVVETQAIHFQGTYQQGFRVIPTDRVTSIDGVAMSESVGGQTLPYRASLTQEPNTFRASGTNEGLRIDWWFPPTTDASRIFVLSYTVRGALRIYDAGDQLQWKAIYADRPGPVAASTVTVRLPAGAQQSSFYVYTLDQQSRLGALPPSGSGRLIEPRTVQFNIGSQPTGTGAEVRVQFLHGVVPSTPPPWQAQADRADQLQQTIAPIAAFLTLLLTLIVLAGGGAALFLLWYTGGRDPSPGKVPARLDKPPSDLPAPLAGTLVDEVADVQDAVAILVDLAQRGVLAMTDEKNPRLVGSTQDVRVTLREMPERASLRRYDEVLLHGLFGSEPSRGQEVLLSEVRGRFAATIPLLQDGLYQAVADEGLFVNPPEVVRQRYRRLAWLVVGIGLLMAVVGAIALGWAVSFAWLPGIALMLVGGIGILLARSMPRRTRAGALEAARWRAFRAHLTSTEAANQPQLLPYAVAFGIDRSFLRKLESIGTPPPTWYPSASGWGYPGGVVVLPGGFSAPGRMSSGPATTAPPDAGGIGGPPASGPQSWSDGLADLLNAASDALAAGGGSGGWSGGGFGGGGGGGGGSGGFQ